MSIQAVKHRLAEGLARLALRLPDCILARMVRNMCRTGRATDACLNWGCVPLPVHYYSPVPDLDDLSRRNVWARRSPMAGIAFDGDRQAALLQRLGERFGQECRWPAHAEDPSVFHTENGCFSFGCAAALHCLLRDLRPERVVEIGSGNSSMIVAAALERNAADGSPARHTIVDPYPDERVCREWAGTPRVLEQRVECVDNSLFDALERNDVLFVDSGHTVRTGGDVNTLILDVLPRLRPGVAVHFHDIHLPYEYPEAYARDAKFRRFWTEAYLLQAFLCLNREYRVLLAMRFLEREHPAVVRAAFPHYRPDEHLAPSVSFWIRRAVPGEAEATS